MSPVPGTSPAPILTVTANPAIDLNLIVAGWPRGDFARATTVSRAAGGKGVNVSRVLAELRVASSALCVLGGPDGAVFLSLLARAPFEVLPRPVAQPTRTNVTISIDNASPSDTPSAARSRMPAQIKVNQPGPSLSPAEWRRVETRFKTLLPGRRWVVLSGALPPGVPAEAYARLVRLARRAGARVALDCAGESLLAALPEKPDLIKPNRAELAASLGLPVRTRTEALAAGRELLAHGAGLVVISHGGAECLALTPTEAWSARPPRLTEIRKTIETATGALPPGPPSPMGAGDSLVAGLVAGLLNGAPLSEALRLGVACGAACAAAPDTLLARQKPIAAIRPVIVIKPL